MMSNSLVPVGRKRGLEALASWTDRIAAGELPQVPAATAKVKERNVGSHAVGSRGRQLDGPRRRLHRSPQSNGERQRPVYGVQEKSGDWMNVLDPTRTPTTRVYVQPHGKDLPHAWSQFAPNPSVLGNESIFQGFVFPHNPMLDARAGCGLRRAVVCRVYDPKTRR